MSVTAEEEAKKEDAGKRTYRAELVHPGDARQLGDHVRCQDGIWDIGREAA